MKSNLSFYECLYKHPMKQAFAIIGPPGSGKTTLAGDIARQIHVPHISMGDLIRSDPERAAKVAGGALLDNSETIGLLSARLCGLDMARGFVLDGFPRSRVQALWLAEHFTTNNPSSTLKVIELTVDTDVALNRLRSRNQGRDDDIEEVIHRRFEVYLAHRVDMSDVPLRITTVNGNDTPERTLEEAMPVVLHTVFGRWVTLNRLLQDTLAASDYSKNAGS